MRSTVSGRSVSIGSHSCSKIKGAPRRTTFLLCGAAATAAMAFSSAIASAQTNNYYAGTGAFTGSVWGTNPAGPYTSPFATDANGGIANFTVEGTQAAGANTLVVAGINASANFTLTGSPTGTLSNFNNGVVGVSVASGVLLDFGSLAFTGSSTAGYVKNGSGALALLGGAYGGGFTLNQGTVYLKGVNALGGSATNALTLNGGTLAGTANRSLLGKYSGGIVIGGDVTLGSTAIFQGITLSAFTLTFDNNTSLGSVGRTITLGGTGTYTWTSTSTVAATQGIISGTGGLVLTTSSGGGTLSFTGASSNAFTGGMTVNGGTLSLSKSVSASALVTDLVMNGGTVNIAGLGNQIADGNRVTINGGTLSLGVNSETVAGVTFNGGVATSTTVTSQLISTSDFDARSASSAISANLAGAVNFVKSTAGAVTLTGTNTYTGATSVTAGTLQLNAASNISGTGGPVVLDGSGRLIVNYANADLSKVAAGGGVAAGTTLRLQQLQTGATNGPGTVAGTVELTLTNINPGYTLDFNGGKITATGSATYASPINLSGNATIESSAATTFTFNGNAGTTGTGTRTLTLGGAFTGIMNGTISEGGTTLSVQKTGLGQWTLNPIGTTFTGGVSVSEGTLVVASSGAGTAAGPGLITLGNNTGADATLQWSNAGVTIANNVLVTGGTLGTLTLNTSLTSALSYGGTITLQRGLQLKTNAQGAHNFNGDVFLNGNTLTLTQTTLNTPSSTTYGANIINGAISGSGNIVINSSQQALAGFLNGNNVSLTASINVLSGTLGVSTAAYAMGTGQVSLANNTNMQISAVANVWYQDGTITTADNGTNTFKFSTTSGRVTVLNNLALGAGTTLNITNTSTTSQGTGVLNATLLGDATIDVTPTVGVSEFYFNVLNLGESGGSRSLTKTGTFALMLGANMASTFNGGPSTTLTGSTATYSGATNIVSGSLRTGRTNALPTGTTVAIASGAVLDLSASGSIQSAIATANYSQEVAGLSDLGGGGGTVTANTLGTTIAGVKTLTLSGTSETPYSFSGNIVNNISTGTATLALSKSGTGTQVLLGTNTYTGGTTLAGGTLEVGANALPTTGTVRFIGGTLRNTSGNTTDYSARFSTVAGQNVRFDTNGNSVAFATAIDSVGGSLTKLGAGVLTLNASNNYSGSTSIAAGALRLGADDRIAITSEVVLAGGTLDTAGYEESVGNLSLAADSAIDLGAGASILSFGGVGTLDLTKSLSISNWTGDAINGMGTDQLYVGEDNSLTAPQLAVFTFVNPAGFDPGNYGATQLSSGEVVPYFVDVPEPSMLALLSLGGLGLMRRRRRQQA